jgi:Tol biopolymer transport system component
MALVSGYKLGSYEIVSALGAGGMGEVYRARDSKLKRDVAIKVLPTDVANDRERLARFQREAEVLASLNHPNIAHVYGIEDNPSTGSGQAALVMELVDGEDLSQRISRGAIPIDEALAIAKQIAEALEAAHDAGIIHRDLKPANIKLRDDGTVKVLDFGLAKALEQGSGIGDQRSGALANSPTITSPAMTMRGVILGTAAYMSPEQAKGKAVDKRADIWAFGCVLFEMLTGKRTFKGDDVTDIITSVMRDTPDWTVLPAETPLSIRVLLRRCLDKDTRKRAPHIAIARMAIDDAVMSAEQLIPGITIHSQVTPKKRFNFAVPIAAIVAAMLAGVAAWGFRPPVEAPKVVRFQVGIDVATHLQANYNRQLIAISPDGMRLAFGGDRLYVRELGDAAARGIPGTEGFTSIALPAFSPDGHSIVFWTASDRSLKKMTLGNPTITTITDLAEGGYGLSWSGDQIFYGSMSEGIRRVPANGGASELVIAVKDREEFYAPQLLPDGDTLLFTVGTRGMASWDRASIVVESLRTKVRKTIVEQASGGVYIKSGHLVFGRGGVVLAVPFDLKNLSLVGEPIAVIEGVRRGAPGTTAAMHAVMSDTGTLAFMGGPTSANGNLAQIARFDRSGVAEPLNVPMGPYSHPRVSPDGTRVAITVEDEKSAQVWVYGLSQVSAVRRLTSTGRNEKAEWSSDGSRLAFTSTRENDAAIWWQRVDGTEQPVRLTRPGTGKQHVPQSFSRDGRHLLYDEITMETVRLWDLDLTDGTAKPVETSSSDVPSDATISPDGKWFSYTVRRLGTPSIVYVEPYPPTGARYQISAQSDDGHHAVWSRDGKRLFYTPGPGNRFHEVPINITPSFSVGNVTQVQRPFINAPPSTERTYDTTTDGRILGLQVNVTPDGKPITPDIQVVVNWFEELKQRVPVK